MKKKKTNIKTIIRQIVREEVAMAIKEVITELNKPTESQPQPQKKIVNKKQYMDDLKNRLDIIKSNKHFIEPN